MSNNPRVRENFEEALLKELQAGSRQPAELVVELANGKKQDEELYRESIMRLLADKRIEFDKNWNLQAVQPAKAKRPALSMGVVRCPA